MGNLPQVPFSFHSFRGAYISFFQDKRGMHPTQGSRFLRIRHVFFTSPAECWSLLIPFHLQNSPR
jgi:hypothetical protein